MTDKNIIHEKTYWDTFYNSWGLDVPSQFCVQAITDITRDTPIVEFGSGNGRDSQYMASQGYILTAMDLSDSAIKTCNETMVAKNILHAFFTRGDVAVAADVVRALDHARARAPETARNLVAYSRFLLHSLDDAQEQRFIATLGEDLIAGDRLFLEFRSTADADTPKVFGNHYRRFVDTDRLLMQMTKEAGFCIDYAITGRGMARFKQEDPVVSRIIATKG